MEGKERIAALLAKAKTDIASIKDKNGLIEVRNAYLSKKSELSSMLSMMKSIASEERAAFGQALNNARKEIEALFKEKEEKIASESLQKQLEEERIDISLPGKEIQIGKSNPYYLIIDEMVEAFVNMGFEVYEGRDIETDHFNFELLNVPKDHPARDMQDTFYITDSLLLRTQTSAAQAHAMSEQGKKGPIKMICPGKCFRRDDDDMTHSHQFGQIEGLVIGKGVSLADLKGTLEKFVRKMFGEKREIRLRSSYFPFTEPSVEVDVSCAKCGGKGCDMCKGTGWIEILGAGMVHPNVLKMCGYDPEEYSGFAFGVGVERLAILRYGIDDIRRIYQNDIRFLEAFQEK